MTKQVALNSCKYQHLYTYKRKYLIWCLWFIMEESGAIFILWVFADLKQMIEGSDWF